MYSSRSLNRQYCSFNSEFKKHTTSMEKNATQIQSHTHSPHDYNDSFVHVLIDTFFKLVNRCFNFILFFPTISFSLWLQLFMCYISYHHHIHMCSMHILQTITAKMSFYLFLDNRFFSHSHHSNHIFICLEQKSFGVFRLTKKYEAFWLPNR